MSIHLSKRAWSKLLKITSLTNKENFILKINGDKYHGIFYNIEFYNKKSSDSNLRVYSSINKYNSITNNLYIDEYINNIVYTMDIDYRDMNYKNGFFESKFLYNVTYLDDNNSSNNFYNNQYNTSFDKLEIYSTNNH